MEDKPTIPQKLIAKELRIYEKDYEKFYFERKKKLFSKIKKGDVVLEIGPGTGLNFKYYPRGLNLIVVEPNPILRNDLKNKARRFGINIKVYSSRVENLPLENNSVDFVVTTLVLCSVRDLKKSLYEIRRVLKKNGRFLFIEHIVDNKNIIRRIIQALAVFPYGFFGDGSHPNRNISLAINRAGFRDLAVERYYQEGLGVFGWIIKSHIIGEAVK